MKSFWCFMVGNAHPLGPHFQNVGPDSATALSYAPLLGNSGTLWLYPTAEKKPMRVELKTTWPLAGEL